MSYTNTADETLNSNVSVDARPLSERAMLVSLSLGAWQGLAIDRDVTREVAERHDAENPGIFRKFLVAREAVKTVQRVQREARGFFYAHTLPWIDGGMRIRPAERYIEFVAQIREWERRCEAAADAFAEAYPALVETARVELNGLFREEDYPSAEEVRARFRFEYHAAPLPVADDFRVALPASEAERIRTELRRRLADAQAQAMADLWQRLHKAVTHAVEQLSKPEQTFRDTLLGNLAELVELLPSLNIGGDERLAAAGVEIERRLLSVSAGLLVENREALKAANDELRTNPQARAEAAKAAKAIADKMAACF